MPANGRWDLLRRLKVNVGVLSELVEAKKKVTAKKLEAPTPPIQSMNMSLD